MTYFKFSENTPSISGQQQPQARKRLFPSPDGAVGVLPCLTAGTVCFCNFDTAGFDIFHSILFYKLRQYKIIQKKTMKSCRKCYIMPYALLNLCKLVRDGKVHDKT